MIIADDQIYDPATIAELATYERRVHRPRPKQGQTQGTKVRNDACSGYGRYAALLELPDDHAVQSWSFRGTVIPGTSDGSEGRRSIESSRIMFEDEQGQRSDSRPGTSFTCEHG